MIIVLDLSSSVSLTRQVEQRSCSSRSCSMIVTFSRIVEISLVIRRFWSNKNVISQTTYHYKQRLRTCLFPINGMYFGCPIED